MNRITAICSALTITLALFWPMGANASLMVTVQCTPLYNAGTSEWSYQYLVTNSPLSDKDIERFAVVGVPAGATFVTPTHWDVWHGWQGDPSAVVWALVDAGPSPPGWDGLSIYPSAFAIGPGETVTFELRSLLPAAPTAYYAEAFAPILCCAEDVDDGFQGPTTFEGVSGMTVGPDQTLLATPAAGSPARAVLSLGAPFPNPTRQSVAFTLETAVAGTVEVSVFDVTGRRVRTLANEHRDAGMHTFVWDGFHTNGRGPAAGVYFVRVAVGGAEFQRPFVLTK